MEAAALPELQKVPVFAGISVEDLACLGAVELIHAEAGADLSDINQTRRGFWILLEGELRAAKAPKRRRAHAVRHHERRRDLWRSSLADG